MVDYSALGTHDKFLCGIVLSVSWRDYFAPISSFKTPQRTNIKDSWGRPISSIRFSFMIPVPQGVLSVKRIANEPNKPYRTLLNMELRYCRRQKDSICSKANFAYHAATVKKDELIVRNCCDFKALESASAEYAEQRLT
jgi:protein AbiQ